MASDNKKIYGYVGKVILITLLIVLVIRCFLFESFSVSTSQMEGTLRRGDKILIDKTAYGIRLPITLLSVPFAFDNILSVQSYTSLVQLPYKRIFESRVNRNDVVLFNDPSQADKPLDKRSLLLSRCIAAPGDTLSFSDGSYSINGYPYLVTPNQVGKYYFSKRIESQLVDIAADLQISMPVLKRTDDTIYTSLSRYDAYILNQSLDDSVMVKPVADSIHYTFTVPAKGKRIYLTEENLIVYGQVILQELAEKDATIMAGKLLIGGIKQGEYTFSDDYYWLLSDNTTDAIDSRTLGFIPFRSIVGKARWVWYSSDANLTCSVIK